jgi:hypothetical protein
MSAIKRIDPGRLAQKTALHKTTRYPAERVTLTLGSRKKLRPCAPHRKIGRGKVGVGGKSNDR